MSLSGNIEDVSVADALQFIHLGGRTGTLTLNCGEAKAGSGFHQGRIVNGWAPGGKRLGELLIEGGVLQQATLEDALRRQESEHPRRSLGQILVAMNAADSETIYRTIEQQIERTVYDLVTWNQGTFHFALDDLKPIDDIAVIPGDVIRHLNLDTQMVLLDALRIFDERNRGKVPHNGGPAAAPARPAPPATTGAPGRSAQIPPIGVTLLPEEARTPLQVVSGDREIADRLAQAPPEMTVDRVSLRDAVTPPPVEPPLLRLVRREGLTALGAFGNSPGGQPLAQLARGLKIDLASKNALTDSLADGQVRAIPFEEATFPPHFRQLVGKPRSGECAIFPVMGGQRVIALVYADNGHSNRAIEELDILELAAAQAGLAFENELLRRQTTHS